jgi:hypothetical protein
MNWPLEPQTTTLVDAQALVATPEVAPDRSPARPWPEGNHDISFTEARRLIARRQRAVQQSASAFKKDALLRLLNQTGCVGVRMYHAMQEDGRPCLVLVGLDENGEELLDGELVEKGFPCPPFCPSGPSLGRSGA